jgi:hypothetical protein
MLVLRSSRPWLLSTPPRAPIRGRPRPPSSAPSSPFPLGQGTSRVIVSLSARYRINSTASTSIHSIRPSLTPFMALTTTQTQTRTHSGHHHSHDNAYLTSTNKNDAGVRITRIGLFVNLGMAIGKGLGGYFFHSQGMQRNRCTLALDQTSPARQILTI